MGRSQAFSLLSITCLCSVLIILVFGRVSALTVEENLEIERRLATINKPPVKTIKTIYGEIIDCVDILKQPAFDHPLLKGHKIQRKPSHQRDDHQSSKHFNGLPGVDLLDCPEDTVPIRRTTKEDLIREKLMLQSALPSPMANNDPNINFAVMDVTYFFDNNSNNSTRGVKAKINLQNPRCKSGEGSGAQIWMSDGSNSISAGWLVEPQFYGDDHTHFSISWKGDGDTGCVDARCSGFVITLKEATLGVVISKTSVYEGQQFELTLHIYQDEETKNWWLAAGDNDNAIGYWPKELFSKLGNGATALSLGGYTKRIPNQPTPPMGSGIIPDCQFIHASYFRLIKYKFDGKMIGPLEIKTRSSCPNDYEVQMSCLPGHEQDVGTAFLLGGPGGDCKS